MNSTVLYKLSDRTTDWESESAFACPAQLSSPITPPHHYQFTPSHFSNQYASRLPAFCRRGGNSQCRGWLRGSRSQGCQEGVLKVHRTPPTLPGDKTNL